MNLNEISIRTHRGEYRAGETIYGAVYLFINSPCPCTGVKLKFKGYEKCSWEIAHPVETEEGKWQEEIVQRSPDRKIHFNATIVIADYPNGIPMGQYCFPFQYPLQTGLPGSFELRHEGLPGDNWEAVIKYSIKAELTMPGVNNTLEATQPLTVYNDAPGRDVETLEYSEKSTVKMCCCIGRGDILVRACMDKKSYVSGDEGVIHVYTHNDSSVDIDFFRMTMNQLIILGDNKNDDHSKRKLITQSVLRRKYDGCTKGKSMQSDVVLKLEMEDGEPLQPSVEGHLLKCRYFTDIDMQIKWAPPINIQPIVHILAPANQVWKEWVPPPWAKDSQVVVAKCNPCAVSQKVLSSQIFAGIPGFEPLM